MSDVPGCLFCRPISGRVLLENALGRAIADGFPVTSGHSLIVPKRHVADPFDLTSDELLACHELMSVLRRTQMKNDLKIDGYNIGVNVGIAAGQTVFHCHFHLIPRRSGDVPDPRGGVRHVIPGKGFYEPSAGER